ncbi:GNAT family N-acetyltransferase [uncultured Microbacterium sp.]|uniref:GNAT family N-acetyltransferase n=1 Tax=uncultured Microbacterium sp. TaxID=191216 RepID=UPI0034593D05
MVRTRMLVGGTALLAGAVVLGLVAVTAFGGGVNGLDQGWHDLTKGIRQPWMLAISYALNWIGGGWRASLLVPLLLIAALVIVRRWRAAVFAAASLVLSVALAQLLKALFSRARPEDMLVVSDPGSFPSGHTANAATLAVILYLIFPRRWVAVLGAIWTVAMALSRTILSVHWLTDTIGGMLVGSAAVVLVAAVAGPWASLGWMGSGIRPDVKEPSVSSIRPYRPSDRDAMYEVCVRTADVGRDATGMFTDDRLWGDIFAVPYVERHPDLCWVVESEDGRTIGYIVSTDDTEAFEAWFHDAWWPSVSGRYPLSGGAEPTRQDSMIGYAARRAPGREPHVAEYPAHLHIDLLPETQGQGLGRRLIETLFAELRRRGVTGLHLGMNPENAGAGAFYERLGMRRLEAGSDTTMYGVRFD